MSDYLVQSLFKLIDRTGDEKLPVDTILSVLVLFDLLGVMAYLNRSNSALTSGIEDPLQTALKTVLQNKKGLNLADLSGLLGNTGSLTNIISLLDGVKNKEVDPGPSKGNINGVK